MSRGRGLKLIGRFGPALVILVLIAAAIGLGLDRYVSLDQLRARREALEALVLAHPFLSLGLYLLVYVVLIGISFPGALVMTLTGGFLFGPWIGGPAAAIGATLGACVIFLICRNATGDFLRDRAGPTAARIEKGVEQNAFLYLLTLRLIPVMPFWAVNLAAGFVEIPLRTFALATLIGILPVSVAYALLGSDLHQVFRRGEAIHAGMFLRPEVLIPLFALALLALVPLAWRRLRPAVRATGEPR
jgi:uncharacterized membrane protein YdjX (TVP38/TMEM64 family)